MLISFAFGPMLGLALADMGGYSTMFLVCSITYVLGVVLAWLMNYEKKQKSQVIEADKINTMENKASAGIIIFTAVFSLISLNKKAREKRSDV